ncbi:uncharacterized protein LOC143494206 [Brachyhypopomus gauderio]|uniref:uncharacterized protein LOC143494206 n=1 Tax=Brachyhypopomus gauderio TaxID=698409 RepID=UPI0040426A05
MADVETLNEIAHLESSGFGQPSPRHGLKLLYWFANKCVTIDENNDMVINCYPENREYGFRYFKNRYQSDGMKLLPEVDFHYYEVGDLKSAGAQSLPRYVSEDYTGHKDHSNMDRIIVSLDDDWVDKVYITTHINKSNFDPDNTYRISKGLLMIIRRRKLGKFLYNTGYYN